MELTHSANNRDNSLESKFLKRNENLPDVRSLFYDENTRPFLPEQFQNDSSLNPKRLATIMTLPNFPGKLVKRETIKAWWSGTVLEINMENRTFSAELIDLSGLKIRTDFSFDEGEVFENDEDRSLNLFVGSKFTFHIVTKHYRFTAPSIQSKIEFIPPYIWKEQDFAKAEEAIKELFPEY